MNHLLNLKHLSIGEILDVLDDAEEFTQGKKWDNAQGKTAANLFFEPSTRTQYSFEVALKRLGLNVVTFNPGGSSLIKGESFYDTVKTFESFGADLLVIRHSMNNYFDNLIQSIEVPIINGGDGTGNHPTQALLDLMTIRQEYGHFEGLKIAIVGDVSHSRVAHTNIEIMSRLGMDVYISGPKKYLENGYKFIDFDTAVSEMDIVMLLRVQHERHSEDMNMTKQEYNCKFGLTPERALKMKKNAIIMHPAPFNRGVEISDSVVECEKSRIFKQIKNGVFVRMAVVKRAFGGTR